MCVYLPCGKSDHLACRQSYSSRRSSATQSYSCTRSFSVSPTAKKWESTTFAEPPGRNLPWWLIPRRGGFGKIEGYLLHTCRWLWCLIRDAQTLLHRGQAKASGEICHVLRRFPTPYDNYTCTTRSAWLDMPFVSRREAGHSVRCLRQTQSNKDRTR